MAFFGLAIVAGSVPAGLLGARLGRRAAILMGLVLLIGLVGSIYAVQSLPLLRGLLVAMGLCWSLVIVNALPMALEFAPPARSGAFTGLFFLATQLAACVGPTAAGAVLQMAGTDYRYLFLYVPCTMALAGAMMLGVRGRGVRAAAATAAAHANAPAAASVVP
jgi:MFS family permease